MGDAYELSVHVDGVPEELRQGVCDASNRLILDAPTGDVEFEPESMTVEDYQTMLDHLRDTGRTVITTVAVHRETGVVAAYTDLSVPTERPRTSSSSGARSCCRSTAATVSAWRSRSPTSRSSPGSRPERRSVQTMNDEQNPWMVQINKDLGFEIIEEALTMKKAF